MEILIDPVRLPQSVPVALFESVHIGSADNNGESFDLFLGLDQDTVIKLRELSNDTSDTPLQENTSDLQRFGDGDYVDWYSNGRIPFALIHRETSALAALVWFGPKPLGQKSLKHLSPGELEKNNIETSDAWHTIAFRSYQPFRGTGIMRSFVEAVSDVYQNYFPSAQLWTSNSRKNTASVRLSEKLGYEIDEKNSDENAVTMIRK